MERLKTEDIKPLSLMQGGSKSKRTQYQLTGQLYLAGMKAWVLVVIGAVGVFLFPLTYILGAVFIDMMRGSGLVRILIGFPPLPIFLGINIGISIIHEAVHGLAFLSFGKKPFFGFKLTRWFFPVLYTSSPGSLLLRDHYLLVALAPFLTITVCFLTIGLLIQDYRIVSALLAAMSINFAGSVGDLWLAWKIRKYDADTMFEDTGDGFNWYSPSKPVP